VKKKRKIRAIRPFKAIEGYSRSSRTVWIESPYATSYCWLTLIDILSRTVSELWQLIVQILDTLRFWATLRGLRDNWTFFARCYGWGDTSENKSKIGDFAPTRSLWPKISGRRGHPPPIIFARIAGPMNALQLCRWQFSHKETL